MLFKHLYYSVKRPTLLGKNHVDMNISCIKLRSPPQQNTQLFTERKPYSKVSKLLTSQNCSQLPKESDKAKEVNDIINNLLSRNYPLNTDEPSDQLMNSYNNRYTVDKKKTIVNRILSQDDFQPELESYKKDIVYIGGKRDQKNLLREINEYEVKKKFSNVQGLSLLSPQKNSFEWMFNFKKEKPKKATEHSSIKSSYTNNHSMNIYRQYRPHYN